MASGARSPGARSPRARSPTAKSPTPSSPNFAPVNVFHRKISERSHETLDHEGDASPEPPGPNSSFSIGLSRSWITGRRSSAASSSTGARSPGARSPPASFRKSGRSRSVESFETWEDILSDEDLDENIRKAEVSPAEKVELERIAQELRQEEADLQRDLEVDAYSRKGRKGKGFISRIKNMLQCSTSEMPVNLDQLPRNNVRRDSIQVEKPLGEGSCAIVCKAEWHGQAVAAKFLKNAEHYKRRGSTISEARETLFKEIEMAALLKHPNLVAVVGTCELGVKGPMLVQELLNCSLKQWYDDRVEVSPDGKEEQGWLPTEMLATRWSLGLAQAVEFLHGLGPAVMHRDIKPDNIMLDAQMNVKLGDFGLARRLPKGTMRNMLSSPKKNTYRMTGSTGSLRYMAPEVLMVDDQGMCMYNELADIYSMSMVMYFICTGKIPFHFIRAPDAAGRSVMGMRPSLEAVVPQFPTLVTIIAQCWAQDPEQRPSASDLVQTLSDIKHVLHEQKANQFLAKLTRDNSLGISRNNSTDSDSRSSGFRSRSMSFTFETNDGGSTMNSSRGGMLGSKFSNSVSTKMWPFSGSKNSSPVSSPRRKSSSGNTNSSSFISRISRSISPTRRSVSPRRVGLVVTEKNGPGNGTDRRSHSPTRPESPSTGSFSPFSSLRRSGRWKKAGVEKISSEVEELDPSAPVERITS